VVVAAKLIPTVNVHPILIERFAADPAGTGMQNREGVVPSVTEPAARLKNWKYVVAALAELSK
jgi:hypothetical protein